MYLISERSELGARIRMLLFEWDHYGIKDNFGESAVGQASWRVGRGFPEQEQNQRRAPSSLEPVPRGEQDRASREDKTR